MAGPPVNLTQPRHPQLLGVVGCCHQTETYTLGPPDTPHLGPRVTLRHVRAPCDIITGRHIMVCLPHGLKGLLRQDLGRWSQTGALPRLQVSQLAGLHWEEGVVSPDFPQGRWPFLVLAAPLIATLPNPGRLWVQRGQGQWEESLIP